MHYFRGRQKGFTLLEIMVSLAIMAIALTTVIQLFSGALRSAKVSHDYSLAVMGAKKKMDEALSVSTIEEFDELEKGGDFDDPMLSGYHWEITGPEEYTVPEKLQMDIEEKGMLMDDIRNRLYTIGVKVTWKSGANEKGVSFTTVKLLEKEE